MVISGDEYSCKRQLVPQSSALPTHTWEMTWGTVLVLVILVPTIRKLSWYLCLELHDAWHFEDISRSRPFCLFFFFSLTIKGKFFLWSLIFFFNDNDTNWLKYINAANCIMYSDARPMLYPGTCPKCSCPHLDSFLVLWLYLYAGIMQLVLSLKFRRRELFCVQETLKK